MIGLTDLAGVAVALERQFPDLQPVAPLRVLGAGFGSIAVETMSGVVVRIAKTAEAGRGQAREARLLPNLRSLLPLQIPDPQWYLAASREFQFGVIGYRKLPGTPLDPRQPAALQSARLIQDLAAFLRALHGVSRDTLHGVALPEPVAHARRLSAMEADVLPSLQHSLTPDEYSRLLKWWVAFVQDPHLRHYPTCLCHGDLWYENLLIEDDPPRLSAVVDFEHSGWGDPAQDFATLLYGGEAFVTQVLRAYERLGGHPDPHFRYRVQRLWEARDFDGLQYAIRHADEAELMDATRKIRQGSILKPGKS